MDKNKKWGTIKSPEELSKINTWTILKKDTKSIILSVILIFYSYFTIPVIIQHYEVNKRTEKIRIYKEQLKQDSINLHNKN